MNTPIGGKLFKDIPRHVAKFRENRPRDGENRWTEKIKNKKNKKPHDQNIAVFAIAMAIAGNCSKFFSSAQHQTFATVVII